MGFLFFLVVSVIAWYTLGQIEAQTREELTGSLKTILKTTRSALYLWKFERKSDAVNWAESPELQAAVKQLLKVPRTREALKNAPAQAKINDLLAPKIAVYGYEGYFVIAPDSTNIGSMRDTNLGLTNLLAGKGNFLNRIFEGETLLSHPLISDVPLLSAFSGKLVEFGICVGKEPIFGILERKWIQLRSKPTTPQRGLSSPSHMSLMGGAFCSLWLALCWG